MAPDWQSVRAQFPALARWTFLNTATFGQLSRVSVDAMSRHLARRDETACVDFLDWFDDMDRLREKIAKLISCSADDIGFVPNASTGLSIFLGGIDWQVGDEVLTIRGEFPNNTYAASLLDRLGVKLVEADGWGDFYCSITSRTCVAVLSTVNYTTGLALPLRELSTELRARGVLLYLDGTQSVGALRFNAQEVHPDFLSVDAYKWLLSPNGAGFVYVPAPVRQWLRPNIVGWRSHRDWRNVEGLHHGSPELPEAAERYEGGMIPFPSLYAMEASVDLMLELGTETIERRVLELAAKMREMLRRHGAEAEDRGSPIVAARFPNRDASRLAALLKEQGILVAARHGNLRVSPHFYNNESDIERLEEAL